mgnify:CR=1 FL=1
MARKKEKRSSLAFRLIALIGFAIFAINTLQVLSVTRISQREILEEDLELYDNMMEGYTAAVKNDLDGYFKELNGYVHADIMETGDLEACYEWIMDPEHRDMRGDFDYVMLSGTDGQARTDLGGVTNIIDRDYFQAIMQQGKDRYIDDPVIGRTTGRPVVHVTRPPQRQERKCFCHDFRRS